MSILSKYIDISITMRSLFHLSIDEKNGFRWLVEDWCSICSTHKLPHAFIWRWWCVFVFINYNSNAFLLQQIFIISVVLWNLNGAEIIDDDNVAGVFLDLAEWIINLGLTRTRCGKRTNTPQTTITHTHNPKFHRCCRRFQPQTDIWKHVASSK